MSIKLCQNYALKFTVTKCHHITCKKSSYINPLITAKHQKSMVVNKIMPKLCSKYVCDNCSKINKDDYYNNKMKKLLLYFV